MASSYSEVKNKMVADSVFLTPTGDGSGLSGLTKSQVGLGNVDNTSDVNKPVSTATQTALNLKQNTLSNDLGIVAVQYTVPTTGGTVNSNGAQQLILNPAGALLALTVNFPSAPVNGQLFNLASTQAITTLTLTGGTILGGLSTLATNSFAIWVYSTTASKWVRRG